MRTFGTVLPTAASLRINEMYRERVAREKAEYAAKRLPRAVVRVVGGETRYYSRMDDSLYAVVADRSSGLRLRYFVSRPDGDHAINLECA